MDYIVHGGHKQLDTTEQLCHPLSKVVEYPCLSCDRLGFNSLMGKQHALWASLVAQLVKKYAYKAGNLGSVPGLGRSPGKGNGYPLQYSVPENSMDRGAWRGTVHGIAKSWTWLSDFHFHFFAEFPSRHCFGGRRVVVTLFPLLQWCSTFFKGIYILQFLNVMFYLHQESMLGWFFFILFFNFTILYWFCHISTLICHRYTHVPHPEPSSLLPPHTLPLGHPSAPAPSIQYRASNLDWRLISYMILYMF